MFWFWFFAGPGLALAIFALRGERKRASFVAERLRPDPDDPPPPATVIVPVNGPEEGLGENLAVLASLNYPDYELILAVRKAADIPPRVLPRRLTVALGGARNGKAAAGIENLMTGVRAARKRSQILAFANGAGVVSENWLRALAKPLAATGVGASTGYVWYAPEPPDFWSLVRSVWNAPIAGLFGPGDNAFAWGGSMAIRKETFFELRLPDLWRDALSADGVLTHAVHQAGQRISFAPGAVAACTGRTSARAFLVGAVRQMALSRLYVPRLWWSALVAHIFYCGGMAAAITASVRGSRGAEWVLVVQLGLGMLKGVNRATLAKAELPAREAWFKRHSWVHALWVPLATWLWLAILLAAAVTFPERKRKSSSQGT